MPGRTRSRRRLSITFLRAVSVSQARGCGGNVVHDELLRLIFTCCQPALAPPTRVALALRTLCGVSPAQIASVLLTYDTATTKRLPWARRKIATAHIPYRNAGRG